MKTEVERLGQIKSKIISKAIFDKYITKDSDTDIGKGSKNPANPKVSSTEETSSGSSQEDSDGHDDSDTDPPYDPNKDSDGEAKPKKPKLKAMKGTIYSGTISHK